MITKINIRPETKAGKALFFRSIDLTSLENPCIVPFFGANGAGKSTLIDAVKSDIDFRCKCSQIKKKISDLEQGGRKKPGGISFNGKTYEAKDTPGSDDEISFYKGMLKKEEKKREAVCVFDKKTDHRCFFYRDSDTNFSSSSFTGFRNSFDPFRVKLYFDAGSLSEGQSIIFSVKGLLNAVLNDDSLHKEGSGLILLLDEIDSGLSIDNIDYVCGRIRRILNKWDDTQVFMAFNSPEIIRYFPEVISMYDGETKTFDSYKDMRGEIMRNKKMLHDARKDTRGNYKIF